MISDKDLLSSYRNTRSREAFGAIVARHGAMVYRTAWRVVGDHHEAEDAAQAAFLALSQKPGAAEISLAGWLHKVARDAAVKLARSRSRRSRREAARAVSPAATGRADDVAELREELDAALVRLPGLLREAIVLHYLEGNSFEAAAGIAGCSEAALRMRTSRGLRRLREALLDRGVACGIASFITVLAEEGAARAAMPPAVFENLGLSCVVLPRTAPMPAQSAGMPVPTPPASALAWAKLKVPALALTVSGGLGLGMASHRGDTAPGPAPAPGRTATLVPGPSRSPARAVRPHPPARKGRVRVIDYARGFGALDGLEATGFNNDQPLWGRTLRLADGEANEARSVFTAGPVDVRAFTTVFRFRITRGRNEPGDGLTFCIHGAGPAQVGGAGGRMGYAGIPRSVAVKFDFYTATDAGPRRPQTTGLYRDGATPKDAPIPLSGSGIDLADGSTYEAALDYDGASLKLTLVDVEVPRKSFTATFPADIPGAVGGTAARVGFTAGTGDNTSIQDVLSWTFDSAVAPAGGTGLKAPPRGR